MDEWGPGGSSEGRCTQMAGRSSEAPFSFVLQFAGTALGVKMGVFLGPFFSKSLELE